MKDGGESYPAIQKMLDVTGYEGTRSRSARGLRILLDNRWLPSVMRTYHVGFWLVKPSLSSQAWGSTWLFLHESQAELDERCANPQ